jgi:16S rRNA (cytidine1402-2'-O)-methyltransferase
MAKLILLTLPIGNSEDISLRAKNALETGKYFFAEDTRTFRSFINLLGVNGTGKEILSFHDNQKIDRTKKLLEILNSGEDVYVVSEAGSPIVSDPAYPLVKFALSEGFEVDTLPGVSSVLVALELSGLPPYPFTFHGFIPRDNKGEFFKNLMSGTHIFFESPLRAEKSLLEMTNLYPESQFAIARELTKKFQTVYRFVGKDFKSEDVVYKGEFVILINLDKGQKSGDFSKVSSLCREYMEGKGGIKLLSKIFSEILNEDAKKIYQSLTRKD